MNAGLIILDKVLDDQFDRFEKAREEMARMLNGQEERMHTSRGSAQASEHRWPLASRRPQCCPVNCVWLHVYLDPGFKNDALKDR